MTKSFELQKVEYMPTELDSGILYVAEKFKAAAHLCACGCRTIIRTPLDRWSLTETKRGPSLYPSIGNWQEPCQSHYWIERGQVKWMNKWTSKQIIHGRKQEEERLQTYYNQLDKKNFGKFKRFQSWLRDLF